MLIIACSILNVFVGERIYLVMCPKKYLAVSMNFLNMGKGLEEFFVKIFTPQCIYLVTQQPTSMRMKCIMWSQAVIKDLN